jgi:hypothetical protein
MHIDPKCLRPIVPCDIWKIQDSHIWWFLNSMVSPEVGYTEWYFFTFYLIPLKQILGYCLKIGIDYILPQLTIHNCPITWHCITYALEKTSLNKLKRTRDGLYIYYCLRKQKHTCLMRNPHWKRRLAEDEGTNRIEETDFWSQVVDHIALVQHRHSLLHWWMFRLETATG